MMDTHRFSLIVECMWINLRDIRFYYSNSIRYFKKKIVIYDGKYFMSLNYQTLYVNHGKGFRIF